MVTQIRQLKEAGKEDMKANEKMSLRKKNKKNARLCLHAEK